MTGHELLNIPEKIYIVGDISTRRIRIDNELLTPAHSRRIYNHSPDGFKLGVQRKRACTACAGAPAKVPAH